MKKHAVILSLFLVLFQSNLKAQTVVETTKVETKIIVYGSADCHYCIDTKKYLTENKIDFVFYYIDIDKAALAEMLAKLRTAKISANGLGIPVIDKYGEIFTNNTTFESFLDKLKTKK